MVFNHYTFTS